MIRNATAVWNGDLKTGTGQITTDSKTLNATAYSFHSRFEDGTQTNPEELIAAAHAGCFSMALSAMLGGAGFTPDKIETSAAVSLDSVDGGFSITKIHLDMTAQIPGITEEKFHEIANEAKAGCPVSKVLNAEITLTAKLATPVS